MGLLHHSRRTSSTRPKLIGVATGFAALVVCRDAGAQVIERFALRGEFGAGSVVSSYQSNVLDYGIALQGSGRIGFTLYDPLVIQASFSGWMFPSSAGAGQQYSVLGGVRVEPRIGNIGRVFIDANVGYGTTGSLARVALDAGLGFEFRITNALGIGPVVRYGRLFASAQDAPSDAQYVTVGLSIALRVPHTETVPPSSAPPSAAPDSDGDGVPDATDLCPNEPAGSNPDPAHSGCPLRDRDHDGVDDTHDLCPDVPAGDHPDAQRPGCPAADSDHDGVLDPQDQCPTTPAGDHPDPARPGCPDGDDDADGVLNHADRCPHEPQGLHPDPARPGCPMPDRDHDSVPDALDHCPDVPGAPNPDPRRNGCPGLVLVVGTEIRILRPVFFAFNRDMILRRSQPLLRAVAGALLATPVIRRVAIDGHTDDVGDVAFNMDLSQRRAANVMAALIQDGVEASRLEAHGYGPTRPLVTAHTAAARAANRRVEFRILDPAPSTTTGQRQ